MEALCAVRSVVNEGESSAIPAQRKQKKHHFNPIKQIVSFPLWLAGACPRPALAFSPSHFKSDLVVQPPRGTSSPEPDEAKRRATCRAWDTPHDVFRSSPRNDKKTICRQGRPLSPTRQTAFSQINLREKMDGTSPFCFGNSFSSTS